MLKRMILRAGAHSTSMSLRCGSRVRQPLAFLSRGFAQNAAALQEPGEAAASSKISDRLNRMEDFIRRHWSGHGTLPTLYALNKEFGGARATAAKALNHFEEELKSKPVPRDATESSDQVTTSTSGAPDSTSAKTSKTRPSAKKTKDQEPKPLSDTEKNDAHLDAKKTAEPVGTSSSKQPAISLWEKLHSIAYGNTAPPTKGNAPKASKSANFTRSSRISESETETESESDSDSTSENELSSAQFGSDQNPAHPLFRSDLQPRHALYLKLLSPQANESDVRYAFRGCGEIRRVQIVRSRHAGAKYIYGFVDFTTEEGLIAALKKEVMVRGLKVQSERANSSRSKEKAQKHDSESEASVKPTTEIAVTKETQTAMLLPEEKAELRFPIAVESIPHGALPQIVEALSHYGEVMNSKAKQGPHGNITAYGDFKTEWERDNALAASKLLIGGKYLKMARIDTPLTTVVRLSNIPANASDKISASYKSYGQVEKVDTRMEGVVDIYYKASEMKNMAKILEKLNALHVDKKKLRAMPAPVCYPKTTAEFATTPEGKKWIEKQKEQVIKSRETAMQKAAMYSQDLQRLLDRPIEAAMDLPSKSN